MTPTEEQLEILEYNFCKVNKHPDPTTLCLIAAETGLSEEQTLVSVHPSPPPWYQPCSPACLCAPHTPPASPACPIPGSPLHPSAPHFLPTAPPTPHYAPYAPYLHSLNPTYSLQHLTLHPQVSPVTPGASPTPHCTHRALLHHHTSLHPISSLHPIYPQSPFPCNRCPFVAQPWLPTQQPCAPLGSLQPPAQEPHPQPRLGDQASASCS